MDYKALCIHTDKSIREALRQLDETAAKILFVVDGESRLTAALTDGDVRRYLLSGGTVEDAVTLAGNRTPKTAGTMEDARALMDARSYVAVPVVDDAGHIVNIAMAEAVSAAPVPQLELPVVIMAGGKGTRLEPYTKILPKPLIPVGDLPIMEHIMQRFLPYGCTEFHGIVNYKKQLIKAYFSENEQHYITFWYDEDKPLGTGGGLSLLKGKLDKTFFLTNCDVLILADYADLLRFHRESGSVVTMVCARKKVTIPYGVIETDSAHAITAMREKPEFSFLTNTGMYVVEPEVLDDIEDGVAIGFPDIIAAQQAKGRKVSAYTVSEDDWLDMGQMEEMERMRKRLYGE